MSVNLNVQNDRQKAVDLDVDAVCNSYIYGFSSACNGGRYEFEELARKGSPDVERSRASDPAGNVNRCRANDGRAHFSCAQPEEIFANHEVIPDSRSVHVKLPSPAV
jgi:hypothetical protein